MSKLKPYEKPGALNFGGQNKLEIIFEKIHLIKFDNPSSHGNGAIIFNAMPLSTNKVCVVSIVMILQST